MKLQRITIIGIGNIGGSLALALRANEQATIEVVGYVRRKEAVEEALRLATVDRVTTNLVEAVQDSDLVVLATPVAAMQQTLSAINPHLADNAVVTDVGSTKVDVMEWGASSIGPGASFVGGHPMAGSAAAGIDGANAKLFRDTVFCIVRENGTPDKAVATLGQLVSWIGAKPVYMSAAEHDHYVAAVSHLPMLLSSALVSYAAGGEDWGSMSQLAAMGFREMTRMAAGSAEVRRSICSTNKNAIVNSLEGFIAMLEDYRECILADDHKILDKFEDARLSRKDWIARRYPGGAR